jgi:hypothetical protein
VIIPKLMLGKRRERVIKQILRASSGLTIFARKAMLLGVLIDLVLIAFATMSVDSPLGMPGGITYVTKATVPLLAYGLTFF